MLATLIAVIVFFQTAKVHTISCTLDVNSACPEEIVAELQHMTGQSLITLHPEPIGEKIRTAMPSIQSIRFTKKLPGTLEASLTSSPLAYVLALSPIPPFFLINEGGIAIASTQEKPERIVRSHAVQTLAIGGRLPEEMHQAVLAIQMELKKMSLPVAEIEYVSGDEIVLYVSDDRRAVLSAAAINTQLATLQQILSEATMSQENRVIDLRFAHPVFRK